MTRKKEKSISHTKLIDEWNWEKNRNINPEFISVFSNRKYWWVCKNGHEWIASVAHRSMGRNCPYCSGQKLLVGYNDLASQYPHIEKEWDYSKNNKKPIDINVGSNKKYWWICSKCNHSWLTSVYVRTNMGCGCPECKKKKISAVTSRKVLNVEKNIVFDSFKKAAQEFNINAGGISNCCRGVSKTAGGYHWQSVDDKKD